MKLKLFFNHIGKLGVAKIGDSFKSLPVDLTSFELNLYGNKIGDEGVEELGKGLK